MVVVVGGLVGLVYQAMVRGSKGGGYDFGCVISCCNDSTVGKVWLLASLLMQLVIADCGCAVVISACRVVDPVS